MEFWTELIWVGNTILPRWFVFVAAIAGLAGIVLVVGGIVEGIGYLARLLK